MIRIGILGHIGSGKSFIANNFNYPVFNADDEVAKLYKSDKKIFNKLKKVLPKYITTFPIDKKKLSDSILNNNLNLIKIVKIVHKEIRKKLNIFLRKNKSKKLVILDIPLLLENKINKKKDILIFVDSKKKDILIRLKKRKNFNQKILNKFQSIQLPIKVKKERSQFIIKNDFEKKNVKIQINNILKKIL